MERAAPDFSFWNAGVLAKRQLQELCNCGYLSADQEPLGGQCKESAIDLRITGKVYRLKNGSVKPFGPRYFQKLDARKLIEEISGEEDGSTVLEKDRTYLLPVKERISNRAAFWSLGCHGQATAKSSIGRLDVLARLIVDGATVYEGFTPECLRGSTGELFVEVTPITFPIRVAPDVSLTQLRIFKGSPEDSELGDEATSKKVLASADRSLRVDLTPTAVVKSGKIKAVAFKAERTSSHPAIDLRQKNKNGMSPVSLWTPSPLNQDGGFKIEPNAFYILRSKELISMPRDIAVYCRASDEAVGEMRIHYAGFVHPRFGLDRDDGGCGTPLIFEVRGHNVPVLLEDGEKMAKLVLYRMSEPYMGNEESPYGSQTLKLSAHFQDWPEEAE